MRHFWALNVFNKITFHSIPTTHPPGTDSLSTIQKRLKARSNESHTPTEKPNTWPQNPCSLLLLSTLACITPIVPPSMDPQTLDYILVPVGLLIMLSYHLWLLHRILRRPAATVVGINAINRCFWVQAMLLDPSKNGVLAVQTLRNNIMASTLLASTAIMLSSVIAVLMTHSETGRSIKFSAILICFLLAFLLNVQSIRYYSHASILINVGRRGEKAAEYAVNRGGYLWSLGLRAFYFSLPLFFWVFGAVPMLVCSVVLVGMLYFLDVGEEMKIEELEVEC